MRLPVECVECGQWRPHYGRGLCERCYRRAERNGRLYDYPRTPPAAVVARELLLDEWARLRDVGYGYRAAAPRLGVTPEALDRALCRAKVRGDERGCRTPTEAARWASARRAAG